MTLVLKNGDRMDDLPPLWMVTLPLPAVPASANGGRHIFALLMIAGAGEKS
jgi:hypothetical protein